MKTLLVVAFLLLMTGAANAWQFAVRAGLGGQVGYLSQTDTTGLAEIGATCNSGDPHELDFYIRTSDRFGRSLGAGTVPVSISGLAGTVRLGLDLGRVRGRLELSATSYEEPDIDRALDLIAGAPSGIRVDALGGELLFATGDANAAIKGFRTVCTTLRTALPYLARPLNFFPR